MDITLDDVSNFPDSARVNMEETNDRDLVQLAGYHAYNYYSVGTIEVVNGKKFEVIDTRYETATGLDALTVQNTDTAQLSVVFVGSDQAKGDWLETNVNLVGHKEPAQLKAANTYFDYVEREIGKVSSLAGNSLGGALANRVAIDNPGVKSVTLNTAILPGGMVDPTKAYSNITNYQSEEYDVLTHVQEAIKYDHRIPGNSYNIKNGLPVLSQIISDHKGYVKADGDGNFKIEIGKKGEPGHGHIHVGADDHIVTSVWTGAPLHGGSSIPIHINPSDITMLADGLKNNVTNRLMRAGEYIENAVSIVDDESAKFNRRVNKLQEVLHELLDNLGNPLVQGMAVSGNALINIIDELIRMLDIAEEKCRSLNWILNSGPAEVIEFVFSLDISVESLFAPVRSFLEKIKEDTNRLTAGTRHIIEKDIPAIFQGGKDMFSDAVVGELDAHYNIVHKNKETVLGQVEEYEQQVRGVAEVFQKLDHNLSVAIDTNTLPPEDMEVLQATSNFCIPSSEYLEKNLKIKELQVDKAHTLIKTQVTSKLRPILVGMEVILFSIENGLNAILLSITTSVNLVAYSPTGVLVNLFTDYIQRVRDAAGEVKRPIRDMKDTIANLKTGVKEANNNLPEVLDFFRKYIDVAIFTPSKYQNVQLYNIASTAILGEMEMVFSDINFQLSNQQAKAIEATVLTSESVLDNIESLREQVEKGTV